MIMIKEISQAGRSSNMDQERTWFFRKPGHFAIILIQNFHLDARCTKIFMMGHSEETCWVRTDKSEQKSDED